MVELKTVEGYGSRDVAVLGDSISANNHNTPLTGLQAKAIGFMAQARALSMGRFNFTPDLNFGVSGDTTALILARSGASSLASLVARRPARVCMLIGTNDIGADVAKETVWANIQTILTYLNGNGIPVDIVPIFPRTNSITSARRNAALWVNQKMLAERSARLQRLYAVLPLHEAAIDRASTTGDFITSVLLDGLHPAVYGAGLLGQAASTYYNGIFPETPFIGGLSQADVYDATNNPLGAFNSAIVPIGTAGTAGTGASGNVATGFSVSRTLGSVLTLTCSKTTLSDATGGVVQDIALGGTGGVALETGIFSAGSAITIPAGLSAGQKFVAEADVETIGMSTSFKGAALSAISSVAGEANDLRQSLTAGERDLTAARRLLRTPPITITNPGTETVNFYINMLADCSGTPTGTVRIRSMTLRAIP